MTEMKWPGKMMQLPEVMKKLNVGRDTIYRLTRLGIFPKPIKVGPAAARWSEFEVDQYLRDRAALRDSEIDIDDLDDIDNDNNDQGA